VTRTQDWLEKMRSPGAFDLVQPLKEFLADISVTTLKVWLIS
jgi:hypothetical protein